MKIRKRIIAYVSSCRNQKTIKETLNTGQTRTFHEFTSSRASFILVVILAASDEDAASVDDREDMIAIDVCNFVFGAPIKLIFKTPIPKPPIKIQRKTNLYDAVVR